jgi:glycine cleavage system T protein
MLTEEGTADRLAGSYGLLQKISSHRTGGVSRMLDRTPLYLVTEKAGATFVEENGWLIPADYGNVLSEYQNTVHHAALFDSGHHGKLEVTGKDASKFLHNVSTNEVVQLPVGSGCEAFLTTGQAKIVAFVLIYHTRFPDGREAVWLDVGPGMGENIYQHLDRYHISEELELADRTHELAQLHLAGPRALEVLEQAVQAKLPDLTELQHCGQTLASATCTFRRHDPLGVPGYDILCPADGSDAVWQTLLAAGARPAGSEAYRTLRVEAGTPVYGLDIDETNLPQEVARTERTVSFTKGCYIGQETVARIRTYGHVNRSLVGLKLIGEGAATQGAKLFRDGKEAGHVTSSVVSPRLGMAIALAYVRRGNQEPGTSLMIEGGSRTAEVVALPFSGLAATAS